MLSGRLVIATLLGSATLAGAVRLPAAVPGVRGPRPATSPPSSSAATWATQRALALVGGALAAGTFLATAVGTRLRIRRPVALQAVGLVGWSPAWRSLAAIDFIAADRGAALPGHGDRQRHGEARGGRRHPGADAETAAGQRVRALRDAADARLGGRRRAGLIPFAGRVGIGVATAAAALAAGWAVVAASGCGASGCAAGPPPAPPVLAAASTGAEARADTRRTPRAHRRRAVHGRAVGRRPPLPRRARPRPARHRESRPEFRRAGDHRPRPAGLPHLPSFLGGVLRELRDAGRQPPRIPRIGVMNRLLMVTAVAMPKRTRCGRLDRRGGDGRRGRGGSGGRGRRHRPAARATPRRRVSRTSP